MRSEPVGVQLGIFIGSSSFTLSIYSHKFNTLGHPISPSSKALRKSIFSKYEGRQEIQQQTEFVKSHMFGLHHGNTAKGKCRGMRNPCIGFQNVSGFQPKTTYGLKEFESFQQLQEKFSSTRRLLQVGDRFASSATTAEDSGLTSSSTRCLVQIHAIPYICTLYPRTS
jgi:hypothetical protein